MKLLKNYSKNFNQIAFIIVLAKAQLSVCLEIGNSRSVSKMYASPVQGVGFCSHFVERNVKISLSLVFNVYKIIFFIQAQIFGSLKTCSKTFLQIQASSLFPFFRRLLLSQGIVRYLCIQTKPNQTKKLWKSTMSQGTTLSSSQHILPFDLISTRLGSTVDDSPLAKSTTLHSPHIMHHSTPC